MKTLLITAREHIAAMGTAVKDWAGAIQLIFYLSVHNLSNIVCRLRGDWYY